MNLANIYALLINSYEELYTISYAQPTTYLFNIVGSSEFDESSKVVYIRIEDRSGTKNSNVVSPTQLIIKNSASDELDLTGSPLKDDCIVDAEISVDYKLEPVTIWKPEEEYQKGLNVEKARRIICNEQFQAQCVASGSVWILCDATNADKTLFLQYEFSEKYFSRGIVTFAGLIQTVSLNSDKTMLRKHGDEHKVETFVENVYQLKSDILIRCSWSTSTAIPTLIDLISCDVTLSHTFRLNDCCLTIDFVNQLRMLTRIREDIIIYKSNEGSAIKEPTYECGCGIDMDDLRDSINSVMTEFAGLAKSDNANEIEYDIESVVQMAKKRPLNDVTDHFWDLLKRCSSYKDLKTAFHMVFQCAARCGIVNIPTNNNRLAEIITEVSNRRLAIPCLTGAEPLELLLEIGLEKLYKDYEFIFTESKICSPNSLKKTNISDESNLNNANALPSYRKSLRNAMKIDAVTPRKTLLHNIAGVGLRKQSTAVIGFRNSNFDEYDTAMKLAKLMQIHCTLEHLLVLQINLNLQTAFGDVCEQLLSKPLKPFNSIEDSFVDQMDINITAHNVREHLEGKDPHSRRITFKSKNKFRQTKTTFFYSMENVCPPWISEGFESEEKTTEKENFYYSWIYQKVQTAK